MADSPFHDDLLSRINEPDRLLALNAVADVGLEHDMQANEWVLSITAREGSPKFPPFRRFNVPGVQINAMIREGWGVVARAAQQENERNISDILATLEPSIPQNMTDEPAMSQWLPTDMAGKWESAQNYPIWGIGPCAIDRAKHFAYLTQLTDGFNLILPNGQEVKVPVTKPKPKTKSRAFRIPETKSDTKNPGQPNTYSSTLDKADESSQSIQVRYEEQIMREAEYYIEKVQKGEALEALIDYEEDVQMPKIYGLILGLAAGLGLFIYLLATKEPSYAGTMMIVCTGIWIIKRIIIFFYNR